MIENCQGLSLKRDPMMEFSDGDQYGLNWMNTENSHLLEIENANI
jgi:hypothetical protein